MSPYKLFSSGTCHHINYLAAGRVNIFVSFVHDARRKTERAPDQSDADYLDYIEQGLGYMLHKYLQVKNNFATIVNKMSVLKLLQLSNGDFFLFS